MKKVYIVEPCRTAANTSRINDGAAAMLIVSILLAKGLKPIASYVAGGSCGVDLSIIGIEPVRSVQLALKKANLRVGDKVINTVRETIDKLESTTQSHDRCFLAEVMSWNTSDIALHLGLVCCAMAVLVP